MLQWTNWDSLLFIRLDIVRMIACVDHIMIDYVRINPTHLIIISIFVGWKIDVWCGIIFTSFSSCLLGSFMSLMWSKYHYSLMILYYFISLLTIWLNRIFLFTTSLQVFRSSQLRITIYIFLDKRVMLFVIFVNFKRFCNWHLRYSIEDICLFNILLYYFMLFYFKY